MEKELERINPKIREYIETDILPKYRQLKGHTNSHISDVIRRSLKIAKDLDVNLDMVYVIAAYHDLGRLIDNETHHLESAKMLRADSFLKTAFSHEEIKTMAEAVEDHRASLKRDPRSLYGKIVSSADRSCDITEILIRAYDYNKTLHPEFSEAETIENVRIVLRGKYIPGAYGDKKMYFRTPEYDAFLKKVEEITATPDGFFKVQTEFNRKRFKGKKTVIFGASQKGYETAQERFGARYKVFKISPSTLSEVRNTYQDLIASQTPIMVFGPVGSNKLPVGTEIFVTESRALDSSSFSKKLRKPRLKGTPSLGVPCYTSKTFVTKTDIKEPVVFDRVLATLIKDGFNIISSWRIVSDNLSQKQYEAFKTKNKA